MKVVIAIDSLKGSLSSMEAGLAVKRGIERVCDADVVVKPLGDGGEGTFEALLEGLRGKKRKIQVTGPSGRKTEAQYGILEDGKTAVIEMAQAAGITKVSENERNALTATTYGVGEMILDAIENGCKKFLIGIGGSATSDGGTGMLRALGVRFLKENGEEIAPGICELDQIARIQTENMNRVCKECEFEIACDVNNPLYGENGAVFIFGPQKGILKEQCDKMDQKMIHYAERTNETTGKDFSKAKGAGAAGGLGYAFLSYFSKVKLKSGITFVLDTINLEREVKDADLVITGEGRLDGQTAMGKAPVGVAKLAKKYQACVIALAGSVTSDAGQCNEAGIDAFFPIVRGVTSLEEAMKPENAKANLEETVEQVIRLFLSVRKK